MLNTRPEAPAEVIQSRMATSRRSPRPRVGKSSRPSTAARKTAANPAPAVRPAKTPRSAGLVKLEKLVLKALEDMKAVNIRVLDVRGLTDVTDTMIVASGTSDRHVKAVAESVVVQAKAAGHRPMGTEGRQDGEWVLVDLQDVLVHVMLPRVREFYALEQLWEAPQARPRLRPTGRPRSGAART
jgi:ribosome-associated protein